MQHRQALRRIFIGCTIACVVGLAGGLAWRAVRPAEARMRSLAEHVGTRVETGLAPASAALRAGYFSTEAEIWRRDGKR